MRRSKLRGASFLVLSFVILFSVFLSLNFQVEAAEYNQNAVLAQSSPTQTAFNRVTASRGMHLGGVFVHQYSSGDKAMYVYDSGNNRILAYLNPNNTNSDTPELVFGQSNSFQTGACNGNNTSVVNPTAATLCLNRGAYAISQEEEPRFAAMDADANGNLYVLDRYNNRVLVFNNPFGTGTGEGDTAADYVWGQADFTSRVCNRGAGFPTFPSSSLTSNGICTEKNISASTDSYWGGSVDVDTQGNLWVTDIVNNRVLRFPFNTTNGRPADNADIVLGQPNMQSLTNGTASCGSTQPGVGLCTAFVVKTDPTNGELYVIHGDMDLNPNYRVTVYAPDATWSTYSYNRQFGAGTFSYARGIDFFDADSILIANVRPGQSDTILHFSKTGTLLHTLDNSKFTGTTPDGAVNLTEANGQISLVGTNLYVVDQIKHNSVIVFDTTNLNSAGTFAVVGEMLGGADDVWNTVTSQGLASPFGLSFSKNHNQLFSSDRYRVLVWNTNSGVTNDMAANFVIGQSNFSNNKTSTSNYFKDKVAGLGVDETNNVLWVARNQEIFAFQLPITSNNPAPIKNFKSRIPNTTILGNVAVQGQSDNLVFSAWSMTFDHSDNSLWLTDSFNNRVVRIQDPYGTTPTANLFIGQNSISGTQCNRNDADKTHPTAQTLCNPSQVAFDNQNNLYIAEGVYEGRADRPSNKRIVEYDRATITAAIAAGPFSEPAADRVYAAPNFTTNPIYSKAGCLADTPCNPISISFDSQNRMMVLSDAYFNDQGKRIYIYTNPLRSTGYVAFDMVQDIRLSDYMGQGGFSAFDSIGNVFVQDHTWNRVVYFAKEIVNEAPTAPIYISPANGAVDQFTNRSLNWNASTDPDLDPITYDLYMGESAEGMTLVSADLTITTFRPILDRGKTYYWQVVAKDNHGASAPGEVWSFSTLANRVPSVPVYTAPTDGAIDQPLSTILNWESAIDPDSDLVRYDVYLGETAETMSIVSANQTATTFAPTLEHSKTYFWKVVAKDSYGGSSEGAVWSFSMYQMISVPDNLAKNKNIISSSGVTEGTAVSIVDGFKFAEGTATTTMPSVRIGTTSGYITIDLGASYDISSVRFQADNNDAYRVQYSNNNNKWTNYGTSTAGSTSEYTTKTLTKSQNNVRYIRISPNSGDGDFRISEVEVY